MMAVKIKSTDITPNVSVTLQFFSWTDLIVNCLYYMYSIIYMHSKLFKVMDNKYDTNRPISMLLFCHNCVVTVLSRAD